MPRFSISFEEVQKSVDGLLDDESTTGYCEDPYSCVIAQAIRHKYPNSREAYVNPHLSDPWAYIRYDRGAGPGGYRQYRVETDEKLRQLAKGFDRLGVHGDRITKGQLSPVLKALEN